jgi:hypothetical protein
MEAALLLRPWRTPSLSASLPAVRAQLFPVIPRSSERCWNVETSATLRRRRPVGCCSATRVDDGEAPGVVVRPPPRDYDFRAETSAATRDTVQRLHPELMDLVDDGTLVIVKRPPHYVERRSDGYVEPEVVYIVGTAHMSRLSADQVNFLFFSLALSLSASGLEIVGRIWGT